MSERWKPEVGEMYYYFDSEFDVLPNSYVGDSASEKLMSIGNCFRTREEATAAVEKFKALLLSLHEEQPVTDCNQLPKLTVEVFNRPDCPVWAQYAAVDVQGLAYWYSYPPLADERIGVWKVWGTERKLIDEFFDSSNWQHSLIKRPAKETKLPEWCKNGALAWENGDYFELEVIDEDHRITMKYSDGTEESVIADYIGKHVKQARLRPYNAEEMKALVTRVIEDEDELMFVTGYDKKDNLVVVWDEYFSADSLLRKCTIDGKPCGVMEHLENGEWVE